MRIDSWECLVFFILAAHSDIDQAKQKMERIASEFRITPPLGGSARYAFPTPSVLCERGALEKLKSLRLGLDKDSRIYEAASAVHRRQLDLNTLRNEPDVIKVIKRLKQLYSDYYSDAGKTVNCVALFALDKLDAFPIDTPHIYKALNRLYGSEPGYPRAKTPTTVGRWKWCREKFGPYAGYASQFLFIDSLSSSLR